MYATHDKHLFSEFTDKEVSSFHIHSREGSKLYHDLMTTLSHGNAFHITGPLWGESTSHR